MAEQWFHDLQTFMQKHGLTDVSQVSEKMKEVEALKQEEDRLLALELKNSNKLTNVRTVRFEITIDGTSDIASIGQLWQEIAEKEFQERGEYIPVELTVGRKFQQVSWGHPLEGRNFVKANGMINAKFRHNELRWKEAVHRIANALKEKLGQQVIVLTFQEVQEYIYIAQELR